MKNQHLVVNGLVEVDLEHMPGTPFSFYRVSTRTDTVSMLQIFHCRVSENRDADPYYQRFQDLISQLERVNTEPYSSTVMILDSGLTRTGGLPFIQMQYVDGLNLAQQLNRQGCLPVRSVVELVEQMARTLAYCHNAGIVHGYITAEHILFDASNKHYRLAGFGASILPHETIADLCRHCKGLLPAEFSEGRLLPQTDIFQLGVIVYLMLCGCQPLSVTDQADREDFSENLRATRRSVIKASDGEAGHAAEVPDWLCNLIHRCLLNEPDHRFANGVELHTWLLVHRLSAYKQ